MKRLLLLLGNKRNRDVLSEWLGQRYDVIHAEDESWGETPFDVCLIDGPALDRLGPAVRARKAEEEPAFLPVMLITSHREAELVTRHLWQTVDELVRMPSEKLELQARIEILLRARRLSLDLKVRNEELESFFHAMSHDLRAPLRAIKGFAHFLRTEEAERLSPLGRHDLDLIETVVAQMQETMTGLVEFARLDYGNRRLQSLALGPLVQRCTARLDREIRERQARVTVYEPLPRVRGNEVLLASALTNLLSNALKFVAPGVQPAITIRAAVAHQICRLEIADNGIGIATEDQRRLFKPFAQLHGGEVYEGIGLGLATVRKAVELMGGRSGVISTPGQGSTFWLDLRVEE